MFCNLLYMNIGCDVKDFVHGTIFQGPQRFLSKETFVQGGSLCKETYVQDKETFHIAFTASDRWAAVIIKSIYPVCLSVYESHF